MASSGLSRQILFLLEMRSSQILVSSSSSLVFCSTTFFREWTHICSFLRTACSARASVWAFLGDLLACLLELLLRLRLQRLVLLSLLLHPLYVILDTLLQRLFVLGGRWTLSPEPRPSSLGVRGAAVEKATWEQPACFPADSPGLPDPHPGPCPPLRALPRGLCPGTVGEPGSGTRPWNSLSRSPSPGLWGLGALPHGGGDSTATSTGPQSPRRPTRTPRGHRVLLQVTSQEPRVQAEAGLSRAPPAGLPLASCQAPHRGYAPPLLLQGPCPAPGPRLAQHPPCGSLRSPPSASQTA